jgi:LPXTG-site transpeptidase (sortase) family protein
VRRRTVLGLTGLGAYGLCLLVTGTALVLGGSPWATSAQAVAPPVALAPVAAGARFGVPPTAAPASDGSGDGVIDTATQSGSLPADPSASLGAGPAASGRPGPTRTGAAVSSARQGSIGPGQLPSFVPVEIALPSGATATVVAAGVAGDGALLIPDNPRDVGYWTGGARPGERFGNVVIAGHVDSAKYGLGVLAELKGVRIGAVLELRAAGQRLRYRVIQTQVVPQQSLATNDQVFRQDGPPTLIVITCGGPFDPVRHRYQDNLIASAVPIL